MVDFRKWFPALAIVALLLGSAVTASAQPAFTCAVTAGVPPLVRAEGITELVGDIVLNCTGGNPTIAGATVPGVNVTVFLNTNVTSRLLNASNDTEALLLIDEPGVPTGPTGAPFTPCTVALCPVIGTGAAGTGNTPGGVRYGFGGIPNAFTGRWGGSANPNQVNWTGVPIDAPGTVGVRVIRITNLRANASQLGVSSTLVPSQIVAFVSITSTQPLALANPQQIIGFVTRGLTFSVESPGSGFGTGRTLLQCSGNNRDLAGDPSKALQNGITFRGRFREGFASSFKRRAWFPGDVVASADGGVPGTVTTGTATTLTLRNTPPAGDTVTNGSLANGLQTGGVTQTQATPGQNLFTESGYYPGGGTSIGLADHGTRLLMRFTGIPTGAQIFASLYELGGNAVNSRVRLIGFDPTGTGAASTSIAATVTTTVNSVPVAVLPVTVTGGAAALVYEIVSSDPTQVETIDIPVTVAFASSAAALGTANVIGSFAPISTVVTASQTAPIPRFADVTTSAGAFTINPCRTNLLFPFVTNQAGFDTGIAISNTSQDIFSDSADQSGPCRVHYFGQTTGGGAAPATQTTSAAIPAGGQLLFVVSTGGTSGMVGTPGFQGYIIAQCDFQYAHGFAFITDGPIGAARVAEGYLALVLDGAITHRTGNSSETLGN